LVFNIQFRDFLLDKDVLTKLYFSKKNITKHIKTTRRNTCDNSLHKHAFFHTKWRRGEMRSERKNRTIPFKHCSCHNMFMCNSKASFYPLFFRIVALNFDDNLYIKGYLHFIWFSGKHFCTLSRSANYIMVFFRGINGQKLLIMFCSHVKISFVFRKETVKFTVMIL
jgi:hypothetical protein